MFLYCAGVCLLSLCFSATAGTAPTQRTEEFLFIVLLLYSYSCLISSFSKFTRDLQIGAVKIGSFA